MSGMDNFGCSGCGKKVDLDTGVYSLLLARENGIRRLLVLHSGYNAQPDDKLRPNGYCMGRVYNRDSKTLEHLGGNGGFKPLSELPARTLEYSIGYSGQDNWGISKRFFIQ